MSCARPRDWPSLPSPRAASSGRARSARGWWWRTRDGWSSPAFIRTGGIGFGAQIGANVTEFVLVLNAPEAVQAFAQDTNVKFGEELSVAAGPVGRSAEASVTPTAAVYAYSRSQGLFAGVSLEGTLIKANTKANQRYYTRAVSPATILAGLTGRPLSALRLFS